MKLGRPPIGKQAMSGAERMRRYRAKRKPMNDMPYEDLVTLADIMDRHELVWVLLCLMILCEDKSVEAAEQLQDTTTGKRYAAVAEALKKVIPLAT